MQSLTDVQNMLEELAYESVLNENSIVVKIGGKVPAVLTVNAKNQLDITCQLATLGEIGEERAAEFAFGALDANTRIKPYAFALISGEDDASLENQEDWPVVLTDTVPLGDLSKEELDSAVTSLRAALLASREVVTAAQAVTA